MSDRIIVIGLQNIDDFITLETVAEFLRERGQLDLASKLAAHVYDVYDMDTKPEMGDAFPHITEHTPLVVALHLYGIDQIPKIGEYGRGQMYSGMNGYLLERCMELRVALVCWGDQPWLGVEQKTQIHSNSLWIYEPTPLTP